MEIDIFTFIDKYGWPGILYVTGFFMVKGVARYLTETLVPKYWEFQQKRIDADQEYRLASIQKIDSLIESSKITHIGLADVRGAIRDVRVELQGVRANLNLKGIRMALTIQTVADWFTSRGYNTLTPSQMFEKWETEGLNEVEPPPPPELALMSANGVYAWIADHYIGDGE